MLLALTYLAPVPAAQAACEAAAEAQIELIGSQGSARFPPRSGILVTDTGVVISALNRVSGPGLTAADMLGLPRDERKRSLGSTVSLA